MLHYFIVENIEIYFRGFLLSGILMSDQRCVEGHAAHCRMVSTTMTTRVIKRQDRSNQH